MTALILPRHGKIDPCEDCGGVANHFEPCVYRCYGCDVPRLRRCVGDKYCGGCEEYDAHTTGDDDDDE